MNNKRPSETIFSGKISVIPMADVSHVERHWIYDNVPRTRENAEGCFVIMKHTKWNFENDCWENAAYLSKDDSKAFLSAWCFYRSEIDYCDQGPEPSDEL
jgi:hypothetical protein